MSPWTSPSCFSTKICIFSLLGNVVFGIQWWLTIAGHWLLTQFTGELTLTFVFMLSFTPDTGKHQLYPVTWRSVLSSQPEGTGICIFRTGQNTLIKATSAFPTDTDALYYCLNSCSTLQTQPRWSCKSQGKTKGKKKGCKLVCLNKFPSQNPDPSIQHQWEKKDTVPSRVKTDMVTCCSRENKSLYGGREMVNRSKFGSYQRWGDSDQWPAIQNRGVSYHLAITTAREGSEAEKRREKSFVHTAVKEGGRNCIHPHLGLTPNAPPGRADCSGTGYLLPSQPREAVWKHFDVFSITFQVIDDP